MELGEFYTTYNCPLTFKQLEADLSKFDVIDLDRLKEAGDNKKWKTEGAVCFFYQLDFVPY